MNRYLVVVTGCTEPSCEKVDSHEHGLRRLCEDMKSREYREEYDCAFMCEINEKGEPNFYPFGDSEVEEMHAKIELEREQV